MERGLFLVLTGAGAGPLEVIYSTYVLTSAGVAERVGPLVLRALGKFAADLVLKLAER